MRHPAGLIFLRAMLPSPSVRGGESHGLRGHVHRGAAAIPPRGARLARGERAVECPAHAGVRRRTATSAISELRALGRKLGARGWLYATAPARYGGGGLDVDHAIILEEEVDRFDLSLPPYYDRGGRLGSASILVWGTEEQRQAFLPPIYRGEVRTWQLLTEPGAGSDLAGVRMTTAVRDGDEYVIKGQKIFVGSDNGTDRIWLIACTDPKASATRTCRGS